MKSSFLSIIFFVLVLETTVNAEKLKNSRNSSKDVKLNNAKSRTSVINHEFSQSFLSEEDVEEKVTLQEVHTYAELKKDPRADLPPSFTICSRVMSTYGGQQIFFSILGENGNRWLGFYMSVKDKTTSFYHGQ